MNRAAWRLVRGQPAQRLSEHYKLDCDFGTAFTAIYKEGDAIYLCADHATTVRQASDDSIAGVRIITAQRAENDEATKGDEPVQTPQAADEDAAAPINRTEVERESAVAAAPSPAPATKIARPAAVSVAKGPARDLSYGDPAKALVEEAIWNLPAGDFEAYRAALQQGKSETEAAQAAGGQIAIIHRKISEYAAKIEIALSKSNATFSVGDLIDSPLEEATLEIIANNAMGEAEKDAAINHLGELQQSMKRGLDRQMSPLQAHQLSREIGERANWGAGLRLPDELKPAYRAVYRSLRNSIRAAVPEAQKIEEHLANLCAAKSDLAGDSTPKVLHSVAT